MWSVLRTTYIISWLNLKYQFLFKIMIKGCTRIKGISESAY